MNINALIFYIYLLLIQGEVVALESFASQKHDFKVEIITDELTNPWGMVFLPSGEMLVTERRGKLLRVANDGNILSTIQGLPSVKEKGQGGLLGIALHPDFQINNMVYLSYTGKGRGGYGTEVARGRLQGNSLTDVNTIFKAMAKSGGGRHFGSRLVFAADGSLFVSLGERGKEKFAQDLHDHRGSLIRINDDGSVPADNPFTRRKNARPEIYSYGHRNIQGMVMHRGTGEIWTHEHGPQGGDEINRIKAGVNYGWPVITYGVNYGIGTKIGEGTHKAGMQQPIHFWVPSIAPSGMTFYTGDKFPQWRDDVFVGSLKFGLLVRLEIKDDKVINEERLLNNKYGRIREVVEGPDGYLYLLTDDTKGKILKLSPL
ncbi:MAG: glucose/arabinose dehydrogenase [Planctomycetota bacterium]|jgi:glucose/arabinose dehydrogenase